MPDQNRTKDFFYKAHEYKQNLLVLKTILWFAVTLPFLIIGKVIGFFGTLRIKEYLLISCLMVLIFPITRMLLKRKPYSPAIKYFILCSVEVFLFLFSIFTGLKMFLSYAFVPLLSCLYLDKKFTGRMIVICYITMLISLAIRAVNLTDEPVYLPTKMAWFLAFCFGNSIEYVFMWIILQTVAARNDKLVSSNYEAVKKQYLAQTTIVSSYMGMLCQKNRNIEQHLKRTARYIRVILDKLRENNEYVELLTEDYVNCVEDGALLHDIGIISIPDKIMNKTEPLTEEEKNIFRSHPVFGEQLIAKNMNTLDEGYLKVITDMIVYHHEQWDGNGYPYKLKGEQIPFCARIMYAVNAIDDMLTDLPSRKALSFEQMLDEIKRLKGMTIDPLLADTIIAAAKEIKNAYDEVTAIE